MKKRRQVVNRLDYQTKAKIGRYLETQKDRLLEEKPSYADLGRNVAAILGLPAPITSAVIHNLLIAHECDYDSNRGNSLKGMGDRLHEIATSIKLLAADLAALRGELGTTASPTLRALAEMDSD